MTTNLPATWVEAEAQQFTRARIAKIREGDFFDPGYAAFDPAASHVFVRRMIKQFFESHPFSATTIVDYANDGMSEAQEALRELIAEKTERGEPLGAVLGAYNIRLVRPGGPDLHRRRGRTKVPNLIQDIVITTLVLELIERFPPLKATRSQIGSKRKPSACAMVACALLEAGLHRGGEGAIQQIWLRYSPAVLNGYQWPNWGRKSF